MQTTSRRSLWLAALWLWLTPSHGAPPAVVVSIRPIHAIVSAVMEGAGRPALLLESAASPHAFSLRPSDLQTLHRADLFVWVGPGLESVLARPLRSLPPSVEVLTLLAETGLTILPARRGGGFGTHEHAPETESGHGAAHGGADPHIWLDPDNGIRIAERVMTRLAHLDPDNAARYGANRDTYIASLRALDDEIRARLAPVRAVPFIVFHDAYQLFEQRYGLQAAGAVSVAPGRAISARRIREIQLKVRETGAPCIFTEPQFEPRLAATLAEATGARLAVLDPLGSDLPAGPGAYPALLRNLSLALAGCLGARAPG